MSTATIATIADAATAEVNDPARSWAAQLAALGCTGAVRRYLPIFDLAVLVALQISVVPRARPADDLLTRGGVGTLGYRRKQQHRIDIALQMKVPDATNASVDPLELLTEQIANWFVDDQHRLATFASARCVDAVIDPWPALDHLDGEGVFTAVIQATFDTVV